MKTLGSHPGAILFRFSVTVIVILILIRIFLTYAEETQQTFELNSIQQTKRIVDASLAIVFSTYAIERRLQDLERLDGANPFPILGAYQLLPAAYQGVVEDAPAADATPGWYYLERPGLVVYRPRYLAGDRVFRVGLNYDDLNGSGRFEAAGDRVRGLQLVAHADS